MERHVKERFVGAAVLVALAVILIPELLSGPKTDHPPAPVEAAKEDGIKTYEFTLDTKTPQATRVPESTAVPPAEAAPIAPTPNNSAAHVEEKSPEPSTPAASAPVSEAAPPREEPPAQVARTPERVATPAETKRPSTPTPQPTAPSSKATGSGWAVQLGSFAEEERAKHLVEKLQAAGHHAYLVPLHRDNGKTLHRVRIGPYSDRATAEAALERVKNEVKGAAVVAQ